MSDNQPIEIGLLPEAHLPLTGDEELPGDQGDPPTTVRMTTGQIAALATVSSGVTSVDGHTGVVSLASEYDAAGSASAAQTTAEAFATAAITALGLGTIATRAAPSGTVVGTTDIQTLTNKTLTSPVLTSPTGIVAADIPALAESKITNLTTDLAAKAPLASPTFTGTVTIPTGGSIIAPTGLVKGDVGLGNVDNTADASKTFSAGAITSGTVGTARLGSGSATSSTFLRGDQTWATPSGGATDKLGLTPTAVKTANYTAVAGDLVPCDLATTGSFAVTFPTAPADGTVLGVKVVAISGVRTLTLTLGGSDVFNVAAGSQSGSLVLLNQGAVFQYKSSSAIWYTVTTDVPLSQSDARYLKVSNNLSDVTAATARTNLGLGAAALLADPITVAHGGTGQTAALAGYDALAPTTTEGDITVRGASTSARLALGTKGTVVGSNGTDAVYLQTPYPALSDVGSSAFSNTTTLTSLLAGGATTIQKMIVGDHYTARGGFLWLNNSGAGQTLTFIIKINGTSSGSVATASITASANPHRCYFDFDFYCAGSGSGLLMTGGLYVSTATASTFFDNLQGTTSSLAGAGLWSANQTIGTHTVDVLANMSTNTATSTITPLGTVGTYFPKLT